MLVLLQTEFEQQVKYPSSVIAPKTLPSESGYSCLILRMDRVL